MNISTPAEYVHMLEQITRLVFALLTLDRHLTGWLLYELLSVFFRNMLSLSLLLRSFPYTNIYWMNSMQIRERSLEVQDDSMNTHALFRNQQKKIK